VSGRKPWSEIHHKIDDLPPEEAAAIRREGHRRAIADAANGLRRGKRVRLELADGSSVDGTVVSSGMTSVQLEDREIAVERIREILIEETLPGPE
jgi:hypothetical protein